MPRFLLSARPLLHHLAAWACCCLLIPAAAAQISVAPTALFLSNQDRFGALHVANQSTVPQEITVDFRFGYPTSDSTGAVFMQYEDSTTAERFSVAERVQAFPRRFILPPGETQVVRLTARMPGDRPDGLYWTRVVTTSTPQAAFPDTTQAGIQPRVIFRLQQVTALFYRQGTPDVEVAVDDLDVETDSNRVDVYAAIGHRGNAPFLGSTTVRLLGADGSVLDEHRESIAVYVSDRRRFTFELPEAAAARVASAEITLSSERTDIPPAHLLHTASTTRKVDLHP